MEMLILVHSKSNSSPEDNKKEDISIDIVRIIFMLVYTVFFLFK